MEGQHGAILFMKIKLVTNNIKEFEKPEEAFGLLFHMLTKNINKKRNNKNKGDKTVILSPLMHPRRLELPTFRSVAERSIQLSYECMLP